MMPVPLADARDEARYGGKAAHLARAIAAALPVPDGFALAWDEVEAIAASRATVDALGPGPWAVRSSAIGEDGASTSFAGQHVSILNVTADGIDAAVKTVHASLHAGGAVAYRARMGVEQEAAPARMAVVIQKVVAAEIAGVLFTRNPLTGARERVIEAAWGLGEVVVSGEVTPDRYRLSADSGAILERALGVKDVIVRPLPSGGTSREDLDDARAHEPCLDDRKLDALHRLAMRCERAFEGEHDIEWAFVGPDLYLLQRRAITR
jgi:pyruvate,water dikinase